MSKIGLANDTRTGFFPSVKSAVNQLDPGDAGLNRAYVWIERTGLFELLKLRIQDQDSGLVLPGRIKVIILQD